MGTEIHNTEPLQKVVIIEEGIQTVHTDSKTIAAKSATDLMDNCKATAKKALASGAADAGDILEELSACVQRGVAVEIERANEESEWNQKEFFFRM